MVELWAEAFGYDAPHNDPLVSIEHKLARDPDLLLVAANWPLARRLAWRALLPARAIENLSFVAGVNVLGEDGNGVRYGGGSALYGPQGDLLVEVGERTGIFTATLEKSALDAHRATFPAWRDADDFVIDGLMP